MIQRANPYPRKKVAIVGSGCTGIAALWALNRSPHDVYIYEAADRLGGHTNTVEFVKGKYKAMVDTGFIVMNTATYRAFTSYRFVSLACADTTAANFINFLKRIRVETQPTEMTFSVSRDQGLFEWAGSGLDALFCQRGNLLSPKMWRMIFDIVRFNQFALDELRTDTPTDETIGDYLEREGYSNVFRDDYLIPMAAAVWSTSPDKCALDFPAVTLIRFMSVSVPLYALAAADWLEQVEPPFAFDLRAAAGVAHHRKRFQDVRRHGHERFPVQPSTAQHQGHGSHERCQWSRTPAHPRRAVRCV